MGGDRGSGEFGRQSQDETADPTIHNIAGGEGLEAWQVGADYGPEYETNADPGGNNSSMGGDLIVSEPVGTIIGTVVWPDGEEIYRLDIGNGEEQLITARRYEAAVGSLRAENDYLRGELARLEASVPFQLVRHEASKLQQILVFGSVDTSVLPGKSSGLVIYRCEEHNEHHISAAFPQKLPECSYGHPMTLVSPSDED
jgi:hypothetical protein